MYSANTGPEKSYEKRSERQREKERYTHLNAEFQRIARRDKKASDLVYWEDPEGSGREGGGRGDGDGEYM